MNTSFAQYYTTLDSDALLAILYKPEEYQPEALEAARQELERRNHTPEELEEMKSRINLATQEGLSYSPLAYGIGHRFHFLWIQLQRLQHFTKGDRGVLVLAIVATIIALYALVTSSRSLLLYLHNDLYSNVIEQCVLGIGFPCLAAFLLWKHYRTGWVLLTILMFSSLFEETRKYIFGILFPLVENKLFGLLSSYVTTSLSRYVIVLIIPLGILAFAFRPSVRSTLKITRTNILIAIAVPLVIHIAIGWYIFLSLARIYHSGQH